MNDVTKIREIASAVVFDTTGNLLLQLRDNIPGILYPGKVGLFGGHREGHETFLECVVREIHEELNFFVPPDQFELIAKRTGPEIGELKTELTPSAAFALEALGLI